MNSLSQSHSPSSSSSRQRKSYPTRFGYLKMLDSGLTVSQVSAQTGVSDKNIYRWAEQREVISNSVNTYDDDVPFEFDFLYNTEKTYTQL